MARSVKPSSKCAAGHQGSCTGKGPYCIDPELGAKIARDARSGRNWAAELGYGAACSCGAGARTQLAAIALKSQYANPTGMCDRHPGGSVWASLPEVWEQIGKKEESGTEEGRSRPEDDQQGPVQEV